MEKFKLICLECGRDVSIDKNNPLDANNKRDITGFLEMNGDFEVECKCGNKIIIS